MARNKITLKVLQSIIGTINFACAVVFSPTGFEFPRHGSICGLTPSSHSASSNLTQLENTIDHWLKNILHPATQTSYKPAWTLHLEFTSDTLIELSSPVSITKLALFIAHLINKKYAACPISTFVSAVGYVHKLNGFTDPSYPFLIQRLIQTIHKSKSHDVRLTIDIVTLDRLTVSMMYAISDHFRRTMYSAMFTLAFHAFLRIGEITVQTNEHQNDNLIQLSQVTFFHKHLTITFRHFKHGSGQPYILHVAAQQNPATCPIAHLQAYLTLRGDTQGPHFMNQQGQPVTRVEFSTELRKCFAFVDLTRTILSPIVSEWGPPLRRPDKIFSDNQIRQLGRWRSDAFKKYIALG